MPPHPNTDSTAPRRWLRAVDTEPGPTTAPDDATELLQRVARGDEAAYAALYDLAAPAVYGVCRRVLRDPAHAEEAAQEAFLQIWRGAPRFDPAQSSALTWMMTIAHRRAVDRVRTEEAEQRRVDHLAARHEVPPETVVDAVLDTLEHRRVHRALDRLSAAQREAIEMAFYGGRTHQEVAVLTGAPLGTIKTRIRDGLIRLRDELAAEP